MVGIIIAIIATLVIAVPVSAYVANTRSKKAMEITIGNAEDKAREIIDCLLYTSPSPRGCS